MRAVTGMVDEKYAWRRKELTAKREVLQEKKWAWFCLCHFERTDFYLRATHAKLCLQLHR